MMMLTSPDPTEKVKACTPSELCLRSVFRVHGDKLSVCSYSLGSARLPTTEDEYPSAAVIQSASLTPTGLTLLARP